MMIIPTQYAGSVSHDSVRDFDKMPDSGLPHHLYPLKKLLLTLLLVVLHPYLSQIFLQIIGFEQ